MIKLKSLIFENVYDTKAIVYHRTRSKDNFNSILTTGFDPGYGDMYGKGLYSTYLPTTKSDPNYTTYGAIQIKFVVEIINFFIFDYNIYSSSSVHIRKVEEKTKQKSNKKNFIHLQAEYFGIPIKKRIYYNADFSSNNALNVGFNETHDYYNKVNGIIFTGHRDGHVLVCYNTKLATPISYTNDDTGETVIFSDIKNTYEFRNQRVTASLTKYDEMKKSPWDIEITPKDYEKKFNLIYNPVTKLYDIKGPIHIHRGLINTDGKLMIHFNKAFGDVYVSMNLESMKGMPSEVHGNFDVSNGYRSSLKFSPKYVKGNFDCKNNNLRSLNGAPEFVGGEFDCSDNPIRTLNGCTPEIGTNLICNRTGLRSLIGAPNIINGSVKLYSTPLKTLKGSLKIVKKDFICDSKRLESMKGGPEEIGGDFIIYSHTSNIRTLEGSPKKVGGKYEFSGPITSLKGITQDIEGELILSSCFRLQSLDYLPKAKSYAFPYQITHEEIRDALKKYGNPRIKNLSNDSSYISTYLWYVE